MRPFSSRFAIHSVPLRNKTLARNFKVQNVTPALRAKKYFSRAFAVSSAVGRSVPFERLGNFRPRDDNTGRANESNRGARNFINNSSYICREIRRVFY